MPGEEEIKGIENSAGAGIVRLGRGHLYARMCILALVVSMTVLSYCAAYVYAAGISLLATRAVTVSFFASLAATVVAALGAGVFCARLRSIDKYDLSLMLPNGTFDRGNLLLTKGGHVEGSEVKAEITMNEYGKNRKTSVLNALNTTLSLVLVASVCTYAATLGILHAQSKTGYAGVVGALVAPGNSMMAQACLVALASVVSILLVNAATQMLFRQNSKLVVLDDGAKRFSEEDVSCVLDKMNIGSSDVMHVRIYRVLESAKTVDAV